MLSTRLAYSPTHFPAGILSRSALLTFAARGWSSPVSAIARVRFAVGSTLLRLPIPFSRELLLALGCVPADRAYLRQLLLSGTSIALTPGGWREPTHTQAAMTFYSKAAVALSHWPWRREHSWCLCCALGSTWLLLHHTYSRYQGSTQALSVGFG